MISATGYPQLVTQMYFDGDKIANNDWIQELNTKDFLLVRGCRLNKNEEWLPFSSKKEANYLDVFTLTRPAPPDQTFK